MYAIIVFKQTMNGMHLQVTSSLQDSNACCGWQANSPREKSTTDSRRGISNNNHALSAYARLTSMLEPSLA